MAKVSKTVKKSAPKKVNEGFVKLMENELEKAEIVIAAKGVPENLQDMAEKLAKVEADDVMPLLDQMKTLLGPQVTDRFSTTVTAKIRELLDAVKAAKDGIDSEISNIERAANGEPVTDIATDDMTVDQPVEQPGDTTIASPEQAKDDLGDALPGLEDFDEEPSHGSAGRARKESSAYRMGNGVKALRESKNPDALILDTFRKRLAKSRKVAESVKITARFYGIDPSDVVSIVREAKEAKRPFYDEDTQYKAEWNPDTMWYNIVDHNGKVVATDVTANEEHAEDIARDFHPGMGDVPKPRHSEWGNSHSEWNLSEDVPVKPMTPADKRMNQQAQQNGAKPSQPVQNNGGNQNAGKPNIPPQNGENHQAQQTPQKGQQQGQAKPGQQQPQGNQQAQQAPKPPQMPNIPGKVINQVPKPPAVGQQAPQASTTSYPKGVAATNNQSTTTSGPNATSKDPSIPLMSKTVPLPQPGGSLMDSRKINGKTIGRRG